MLLKRSLSLLLCALLALSLCVFSLPRTARAAPPTGVWVGGTEVTAGGYWLNDGTGGLISDGANSSNYNVRYDSGTLYLKDALITKNISWEDMKYNRTAAVYTSGSLRIMLEGRSQLCGADITGSFPASFGVRCTGDLVIQGGGSLTAIGGMATFSYGLNCTETLTFGGSGSVIATGGTATGTSYGVLGARITVSDGTLTATGGTATSNSYGVYSGASNPGPITVSGGTLIATGGTATDASGRSCGVFGNNGVHIAGGLTVARSGVATTSQAMNANPSLTSPMACLTGAYNQNYAVYGENGRYAVIDESHQIQLENGTPVNCLDYTGTDKPVNSSGHFEWVGSTLTLTNVIINTAQVNAVKLPSGATLTLHGESVVKGYSTESNPGSSYGIRGDGGLTLNGDGSIIAIGGTVANAESYGVYAGALTLGGSGSLTAIGGTTTNSANNSYGISGSSVTLAGGNLTAIGGTAGQTSYGVYGSSVTAERGALTAIGGTAALFSYGVYGGDNITIEDGMTTALGGTADASYGMHSISSVTVSGGTVAALGGTAISGSTQTSYGIFGSERITVENGTVTAMGGWAYMSNGMHSKSVTLRGGTLTASGVAEYRGVGVLRFGGSSDSITLTGGTLTASGSHYVLSMLPVFSDAQQSNDRWYMWKTGPAHTYTKSSVAPYDRNPLNDQYLKVTPAMDAPVPPAAPTITTQPAPQRITMGNAATFTVAASGNPAPTYQWQVSTDDGATWSNVADGTDGTTASYTTPGTTASMNGYQYRCVVSNGVSPDATSDPATLTVYVPVPNVDVVPASLTFGSFPAGSAPLAQVVTVTNRDTNTMSFELPQDNDLIITAIEGFTGHHAFMQPGGSAKFSVQPKRTLPVDSYSNTISLVFKNSTFFDIPVAFTVTPAPTNPGGGSSSIAGGGAYTGNQYPGSFAPGANGGPVLTVQAPCEKCVSVIVDGVQLQENADYTKVCGSTIITFTPSYLATLANGTHSIRVQFTDGRYDGNFITPFAAAITAAPMADVPATGDTPPLAKVVEWLLRGGNA